MDITTEDLATEAGAMALELRIKNRRLAALEAEVERLRALLAADTKAL